MNRDPNAPLGSQNRPIYASLANLRDPQWAREGVWIQPYSKEKGWYGEPSQINARMLEAAKKSYTRDELRDAAARWGEIYKVNPATVYGMMDVESHGGADLVGDLGLEKPAYGPGQIRFDDWLVSAQNSPKWYEYFQNAELDPLDLNQSAAAIASHLSREGLKGEQRAAQIWNAGYDGYAKNPKKNVGYWEAVQKSAPGFTDRSIGAAPAVYDWTTPDKQKASLSTVKVGDNVRLKSGKIHKLQQADIDWVRNNVIDSISATPTTVAPAISAAAKHERQMG